MKLSFGSKLIGRSILALEKHHFKIEHQPLTQHRNAEGFSEHIYDYKKREALRGLMV